MKIRAGAKTDIGRARQRNEDSFVLRAPLYAVADGMGGHRGGDVASSLALEVLAAPSPGSADARGAEAMVEAIRAANRRVLERGEADRDLRGMGTTLTALWADGDRALVAHVGDSRAYLLRDGTLQQLTEDHTLVQRMVREGRISEDEAAHHPQRSILTRALGVEEELPVDELWLDLHPGDRLLLCSDGLTSMLDRDPIRRILQEAPDPQTAAERLVDEANLAGGEDNITAVVLDVDEGSDEDGPRAPEGSTAIVPPDSPRPAPAAGPPPETSAPQAQIGRPARRSRWRRVALWAAVAVAVLAAAYLGTRLYVNRQWYVGESNARVAIYHGIPAKPLGLHLSHVYQNTSLPAAQVEQLQPYRELAQGITAGSLSGARQIVVQIQRDLQVSQQGGATP